MGEVERATWEISCRNCDRTKPGEVIPESPPNGFLISRAVLVITLFWDEVMITSLLCNCGT